jgi:glycosyltransferase involved in cell wall biosynthesis
MGSKSIPGENSGRLNDLPPAGPDIRVDILICCHNDAALLPDLLEALSSQTAGRRPLRIILVDNASTDDPKGVADRFADRLDIEYVHESVLGLNRARNTGHAHARAAFVAHIDADTVPDPGWAEAILNVVGNVDCDLFGGPYRPHYLSPKPPWFLDRFLSHGFGDAPRYLTGREHPHGMNMVWKRETVARLGGFGLELGLHGRGLVRGDETELVARGKRTLPDFKVYYHPGVSVRTAAREEVLSFRYWIRRNFAHGRTCRTMWGRIGPGMRWPWPIRGLAAAAGLALALMRAPFRNRGEYPFARTYLFEKALPFVFHLGSAFQDFLDVMSPERLSS